MALAGALAGLAIKHRSLESFPFTNIEHTVVQGLLGEVHQESLSCTCNKLHM